MKKAIILSFSILIVVFLSSMILNKSAAQSSTKKGIVSKPISPSVMKIAERSCLKCHTEPGNGMALAHLNLSNWDKFSMEKQADKAKDKMPPKSFREKNPDGVPTQKEVKTICDWAQSIQIIKK